MAQRRVSGLLNEIKSLVLFEKGLKWKYVWFFYTQLKQLVWENCGCYVKVKVLFMS